jgi:hypothetical protein
MGGKLQLAHVQRLVAELNRRDDHGGIVHPLTCIAILGQLKRWRADPGYDREDPAVRELIDQQLLKHQRPSSVLRKAS